MAEEKDVQVITDEDVAVVDPEILALEEEIAADQAEIAKYDEKVEELRSEKRDLARTMEMKQSRVNALRMTAGMSDDERHQLIKDLQSVVSGEKLGTPGSRGGSS